VESCKLRYFNSFGFFDHTGFESPTFWFTTRMSSAFPGVRKLLHLNFSSNP
jgi:hypothetical protein